jgi:SAM-dependent methyltransferase
VGVYGEQVLPRLIDRACGLQKSDRHRRRVCAGLAGEVVELGFGSGLNVPFYPPAVTAVAAVEPSDVAWRLAGERVAAAPAAIRRVGLDGAALPLEDGSCDAALSTWTLCTIPDLDAALAEVRRVLRPGGALHFVEHGLAPDERVRRFQRRWEPAQKRLFGGCHVTRPIADRIAAAGFAVEALDAFYEPRTPKVIGATAVGVARPA